MRALARVVLVAALVGGLVESPRDGALTVTDPVPELNGSGLWDKAICLGCAGVIVGGGQLTWGGILLLASLNPEFIAACAYQCYTAFAS